MQFLLFFRDFRRVWAAQAETGNQTSAILTTKSALLQGINIINMIQNVEMGGACHSSVSYMANKRDKYKDKYQRYLWLRTRQGTRE